MTELLSVPPQLTALDWAQPVDRPFVPLARRRLVARPSRLVDLVTYVGSSL